VCVHGALDRGASFSRVRRRLRDHDVITYDRRGYGQSIDVPVEGGIDRQVADLAAIIGKRRVIAVGHSFGGLIVLGLAAQFPSRVAALVVYEPPLSWLRWWGRARSQIAGGEVAPALAAEQFFRSVVSDQAWERLDPATREQRQAEGPALVADLVAARARPPFDPAAIVAPTVVTRGEHALERHVRGAETLSAWLGEPDIHLIAGAHHGAHMSHPDSFAELVEVAIDRSLAESGA
jgi:pimeloyl-ACP methyl ester carboxylesterase